MLGWLWLWIKRLIGVVICVYSWLTAWGIATWGSDWLTDGFRITGLDELLVYGIVEYLGPVAGVILFLGGGTFLLWAFWQDPRKQD